MRIEEHIEISRPVEIVYDFMAKVNNLTRCSDVIVEVRDAPDHALQAGDTYSTVAKVMGRTVKTSHTVITADSPNRLVMDGKNGSLDLKVEMAFEPSGEGTRLTQIGEGEVRGALRFARSVLERTVRHQVRSDLENVKRILEQEHP